MRPQYATARPIRPTPNTRHRAYRLIDSQIAAGVRCLRSSWSPRGSATATRTGLSILHWVPAAPARPDFRSKSSKPGPRPLGWCAVQARAAIPPPSNPRLNRFPPRPRPRAQDPEARHLRRSTGPVPTRLAVVSALRHGRRAHPRLAVPIQ